MNQNSNPTKFATPITTMAPKRLVWPVAWAGHIPFAWWLTESLRPKNMVELGTHIGNSYCAFLQAARNADLLEGPDPSVFRAVDHWHGDEHAGAYDDSVYQELLAYTQTEFGDAAQLMRMSFDDALEHIDDGTVDLLHIDGLHTYEAVRHDFESWQPKLTANAVVLFHDTHVFDRDFGVFRLFKELSEKYPSFDFPHSNGLGVIATGSEVPEPIRTLTTTGIDEDGLDAAAYFGNLGNNITNSHLVSQLESEIEILTEQRNRYEANVGEIIADRAKIIADLNDVTADRDRLSAEKEKNGKRRWW